MLEDKFKWSSGQNSSWEPKSVNWKNIILGATVVGVGALVVGKVAYDAYQDSQGKKKKEHQQNLLSLGWEEGVGKKGSRQNKKDSFDKIGNKQTKNLPVYEPPIHDSSVSDFVSSFEYRKEPSLTNEDDNNISRFSNFVSIVEDQTYRASNIVNEF